MDLQESATVRRRVRRNHPGTSFEAAQATLQFAGKQQQQIIDVLQRAGLGGLTAHQIAEHCSLSAHQVLKRTGELEREGRIEELVGKDGQPITRKNPASGREARVFILAPQMIPQKGKPRTRREPSKTELEAALLWVLWHHQGGSSRVGQAIRKLLNMGEHEQLSAWQLKQAKTFDKENQ